MEFPVKIKNTNPALAKLIITQYGGCDGEVGAALRYLSQRFSMITPQAKAVLTDIGTEELARYRYKSAIPKNSTFNNLLIQFSHKNYS